MGLKTFKSCMFSHGNFTRSSAATPNNGSHEERYHPQNLASLEAHAVTSDCTICCLRAERMHVFIETTPSSLLLFLASWCPLNRVPSTQGSGIRQRMSISGKPVPSHNNYYYHRHHHNTNNTRSTPRYLSSDLLYLYKLVHRRKKSYQKSEFSSTFPHASSSF